MPGGSEPKGELPGGQGPAGSKPNGELPGGQGPAGSKPNGELPGGQGPAARIKRQGGVRMRPKASALLSSGRTGLVELGQVVAELEDVPHGPFEAFVGVGAELLVAPHLPLE